MQDRSRRRARFVGEVKAVIRAASNEADKNLASLAKTMKKDKGTISRALNSDTNIELFTMFEFSEALGKEWKVALVNREQDLGTIVAEASKTIKHNQTSWSPIVPKSKRDSGAAPEKKITPSRIRTFKIGMSELV